MTEQRRARLAARHRLDGSAGSLGEQRGDAGVLPGDLLAAEAAAHELLDDPNVVLRQF